MTRSEVVAESRAWIGTPFAHQGHLKGIGCDCVGLVGGVAVALGLLPNGWWLQGFNHAGYPRQPDGRFIDICREYMTEIDINLAQPGDAVAMRFRRDPQHLGLLSSDTSIVHALSSVGRVTEHRIDSRWRRLVTHAFRLPGIA